MFCGGWLRPDAGVFLGSDHRHSCSSCGHLHHTRLPCRTEHPFASHHGVVYRLRSGRHDYHQDQRQHHVVRARRHRRCDAMVFIVARTGWASAGPRRRAAVWRGGDRNARADVGWVRANPIIVSIAALAFIYGVTQAFAEKGTIYANPGVFPPSIKGKIAGMPIEFLVFLVSAVSRNSFYRPRGSGATCSWSGRASALPKRSACRLAHRHWRLSLAGLFTSLAGIMLAVRYDAANMDYGVAYDYDAIAAVLVGGTAIGGGHGSAVRTSRVRWSSPRSRSCCWGWAGVAIFGRGTDRSRGHHPAVARRGR